MADNLPPSSADVTEPGSLNLPRTLWAPQACNGITLPFYIHKMQTHIPALVPHTPVPVVLQSTVLSNLKIVK
jgi:hypothetical protein